MRLHRWQRVEQHYVKSLFTVEIDSTAESITARMKQADRDEGRREDGLTTKEREELRRLRRENRQLKLEREILAKATAWFARESNSIPSKDTNS